MFNTCLSLLGGFEGGIISVIIMNMLDIPIPSFVALPIFLILLFLPLLIPAIGAFIYGFYTKLSGLKTLGGWFIFHSALFLLGQMWRYELNHPPSYSIDNLFYHFERPDILVFIFTLATIAGLIAYYLGRNFGKFRRN